MAAQDTHALNARRVDRRPRGMEGWKRFHARWGRRLGGEVPGVPTIVEVAERAGVGVATVSRVLNSPPSVSRAPRRRVLAVLEELGYAPNAAARALPTGRTCAVGVVAPFLPRPSVVERLRGVARRIAAAGYQLV